MYIVYGIDVNSELNQHEGVNKNFPSATRGFIREIANFSNFKSELYKKNYLTID